MSAPSSPDAPAHRAAGLPSERQLADRTEPADPADQAHAEELSAHRAAYDRLASDARARLGAWSAPTQQQDRLRRELLDALPPAQQSGAVMAKGGPPAHFTAGLVVLNQTLDAVLLTHHRKAGRWFQFGGHFEPQDTSILAGALREGREESGIEDLQVHPELVHVDRHSLPEAFGHCREHLDLRFAAIAPTGAQHIVSDESLDVRWWPINELPADAVTELSEVIGAARIALTPQGSGAPDGPA